MRKKGFLKKMLIFSGAVIFLSTGIKASEAQTQIVPEGSSDSSFVQVDSLTPVLKGIKAKKKRIRKPEFFSGALSLAEIYDDNILEYSALDIQRLESDSFPSKFAIRSPGDYRTSFDLKVDLNPDLFRKNPTRLRFRFGVDVFARNMVETYELYGADLKQNFFRRNYFQFGLTYLPNFYLRNLVQVDQSTGGRGKYLKATFSKRSYFFELGRRFSTGFAFSLGYGYEKTDYNSEFDERDSKANIYYGDLNLGLGKYVDLNIGYSHKDSKAKGADMMLLIEDVSNKTDRFNLGMDFNLRKALRIPLSFAPSYTYEYQKYTTYKTLDIYHYGRKDNYYRISSELSYRWAKYITQYLRYSYERNKTNLMETLDVGDYKANKVSSGLILYF